MKSGIKDKKVSRRDFIKKTCQYGTAAAIGINTFHIPKIVWGEKILKPLVGACAAKPGQWVFESMNRMPKILKEKYGIQIDIQIHHSNQFGSSIDGMDAAINGVVDMAGDSFGNFSTFTNAHAWGVLPFIYKDDEWACKVIESDLMDIPNEQIKKELNGTKVLSQYRDGGWRILWNSDKELRVPGDIQGRKFRSTASPVEIALLKAWGTSPIPIAFNEIYTSCRQGLIKGCYTQPTYFYPFSFYEIMKYGTMVHASSNACMTIMNGKRWEGFPKDIQEAFVKTSKEIIKQINKEDIADERKLIQLTKEKGVKIYEPTVDEMKIWRTKGVTVWDDAKKYGVDPEFVKKILAFQDYSL